MITTEEDYKNACIKLEAMGDAPDFGETKESIIEFEKLSDEIEEYQNKHYKITKTD